MNFGPVLCGIFLAVQMVLFLLVAIIPLVKTGRMSYVDIAWPFGVALIGVQIAVLGDGDLIRKLCIAGVYLLIGLRMGVGALTMAIKTGVIFKTEFPRYVYRRMELSGRTEASIRFQMGAEVFAQGLANASVLAIPGFLMTL